jgi:hypothetical protein
MISVTYSTFSPPHFSKTKDKLNIAPSAERDRPTGKPQGCGHGPAGHQPLG